MAKSDYIPHADNDLLIWHDCFKSNLQLKHTDLGLTKEDMLIIDADSSDLHAKISASSTAAAAARHATSEKNASRDAAEAHVRAFTRRIKAHPCMMNFNNG